jgi:hypothetical protein
MAAKRTRIRRRRKNGDRHRGWRHHRPTQARQGEGGRKRYRLSRQGRKRTHAPGLHRDKEELRLESRQDRPPQLRGARHKTSKKKRKRND